MLKYKEFTVLKLEEKLTGELIYYDMIIIFDKFRNYIFEITNVHINQEGKLISILNIFLNKGSSIELISEETKKFTRMKEFTQKFLKTYFMEQNKA